MLVQTILSVLASVLVAAPATTSSGQTEYVCPPCGHDCLKTVYHEPGACGECGMKLITLAEALNQPAMQQATQDPKQVAILVFEGVQIIDFTGPWEILGQAGYHVFTVSLEAKPLATVFGMKLTPDYALGRHPKPDIVVVPGGQVFTTQRDPKVQEWLRQQAKDAKVVLSVCNGAFILAKTGLLNGLEATTTRGLVDGLANAGADITVVRDVRYVDNGKVVTSGGLSAGMDAALHVVSRLEGQATAKRIAQSIEYAWNED